MSEKKLDIKNAAIGSICEGLILRNASIVTFFNAKATIAEQAEIAKLNEKVMFDMIELNEATTVAEKEASGSQLMDSYIKRAEAVTALLVREEGEKAETGLAKAFALAVSHPVVGGAGYDAALEQAGAPTLAKIVKKAYELNKQG